jgi:L-fuculose-phosphate aldolase
LAEVGGSSALKYDGDAAAFRAAFAIKPKVTRANRMTKVEKALRLSIIAKARWMNASGLNQGSSGNISARSDGAMLITPSATPYDSMKPEMIATMPLAGEYGAWTGPLKPSTEWRFHLDIMRARADVGAIVHTHSTYATVLAIARREIPAVHYMIAAFGGPNIRCAGYARYGTKELSDLAVRALEGRNGCLLANHGMIAVGPNLDKAMWLAVELETLARQYYLSRALEGRTVLSDAEIADVARDFASYGLKDPPPVSAASARRRRATEKVA